MYNHTLIMLFNPTIGKPFNHATITLSQKNIGYVAWLVFTDQYMINTVEI